MFIYQCFFQGREPSHSGSLLSSPQCCSPCIPLSTHKIERANADWIPLSTHKIERANADWMQGRERNGTLKNQGTRQCGVCHDADDAETFLSFENSGIVSQVQWKEQRANAITTVFSDH
jgi:hypothetical protein